ncbi:hypothetical protein DL95DRAFT_471163 [Leptodontidium sp. 2 PMI_412]|nr:hypothetical protein DL95DRAFT_471163 [Leptodontidium sp. 2 PMI_412]
MTTMNVPTPRTPTHTASRDDRLRIQTLYCTTGWSVDDILLQNPRITHRQVQYALENRPTLKSITPAITRRSILLIDNTLSTGSRKALSDETYRGQSSRNGWNGRTGVQGVQLYGQHSRKRVTCELLEGGNHHSQQRTKLFVLRGLKSISAGPMICGI